MLQSVRTVTYRVPDLEAARNWYRRFLDKDPLFDSPMATVFAAGDSVIILIPAGNSREDDERLVVYWNVDDIDGTYQRLLDLGAKPRSEIIVSAFRSRVARVVDPFGNVLGISSSLADAKGSVEDRPSDSAMTAALCRALAALDPRDRIRGPDHLAEIFLAADSRKVLGQPASREFVAKQLMLTGTYEFFIARTAWFDGIVREALAANVPQLVFLGAGYDSRPYRFREMIRGTRIFELDAAPTQERKRRLLQEAKVAMPPQVAFVPVNFVRDRLERVLAAAGFDSNMETLFIWEGVTYYLSAEAIDKTLDFVKMNSAPGSTICFDYLIDAPDIMERHGVRDALTAMRSVYKAEPIQFRIPEGSIEQFLSQRGYSLREHVTPGDMQKRYLTLADGSPAGKVLACFGFAHAVSAA